MRCPPRVALLAAIVSGVAILPVSAGASRLVQPLPDFSGTWTLVRPASPIWYLPGVTFVVSADFYRFKGPGRVFMTNRDAGEFAYPAATTLQEQFPVYAPPGMMTNYRIRLSVVTPEWLESRLK